MLGAADDSLDLASFAPTIAKSGHVAVRLVSPPSGGVGIYDSTGRLVHVMRGAGGGPGELRDVNEIGFGPGDSLWVVDRMRALHVYAPAPTFAYVRTVQAERPLGGTVTSFGILSPALVWYPKLLPPELIGWDGKVRTRFGGDRPISESEERMGAVLLVDSAHMWTAHGNAYVLNLMHSDGTSKRQITRNVDWFPPGRVTTGYPWQVPPRPRITSISVDSDGLLWVLTRRAHRQWRADSTFGSAKGPISINALPSRHASAAFFETVIDVLDPQTGDLIATTIVPGTYGEFVQPGVVYDVREDNDGLVRLALVRVSLSSAR